MSTMLDESFFKAPKGQFRLTLTETSDGDGWRIRGDFETLDLARDVARKIIKGDRTRMLRVDIFDDQGHHLSTYLSLWVVDLKKTISRWLVAAAFGWTFAAEFLNPPVTTYESVIVMILLLIAWILDMLDKE